MLEVRNPRLPDAFVEWSYKQREFIRLPDPPNTIALLSVPTTILHVDSDEAKAQLTGGSYGICLTFRWLVLLRKKWILVFCAIIIIIFSFCLCQKLSKLEEALEDSESMDDGFEEEEGEQEIVEEEEEIEEEGMYY